LAVLAIHLCFLPWAVGSMRAWAQEISLALAVVGIILALVPRDYSSDLSGGPVFRLEPWRRLVHFPLFWLGLALLGYIVLQSTNPSWVFEQNTQRWWLHRVKNISWLPTSISTPFARFNLWRQFIIYASAWLTICTVWIGFTRRSAIEALLVTFVINGVGLGMAGLYLRATATRDTVLWIGRVGDATPFASFYYHNHAGAYLNLIAVIAAALAFWYFQSGIRRMKKSTPTSLCLTALVFFCVCVLFTYARGAAFALTAALLLMGIYLIWHFAAGRFSLPASPVLLVALGLIFFASIGLVAWQVNLNRMWERIDHFAIRKDKEASVHERLLAYDSALAMLKDRGVRGVGAGGFRFLFPDYSRRHPEIYQNGNLFWEHAHCDWLEIPIDLGLVGSLLILGALGYIASRLILQRVWRQPLPSLLLLGCLQTMLHAWIDFPFQNPAIFLTWCVIGTLSLRLLELNSPSSVPSNPIQTPLR
jgi:hypothetical protein